jgi:hypothetical protein
MVDEKLFSSGNLFWIYFTIVSGVSMVYLMLWGFNNENLKALAIGIIFSLLILFSYVLSKGEIFRLSGSFGKNAFFWLLGFFGWGAIVVAKKLAATTSTTYSLLSTVTPQRNVFFAEISAEIPLKYQFIIDQITNPFVEELFWLIGLPFGIVWILKLASEQKESLAFLDNPIVVFIVALLVSGLTFPLFHIPTGAFSAIILFVISAFIFRSITIAIYWGDDLLDIFPGVTVIASFAVGMHMANNWFDYGFFKGVEILTQSAFGWTLLVSLIILVLAGLDYIIEVPLNLLFSEKTP